ncbi:MAG: tetratricopeptide repeat protein [Candidatus Omnitrophica bacterium]|nr:tetratricopeptide repeat protein [Candidatus Omnitrophota bacterium]
MRRFFFGVLVLSSIGAAYALADSATPFREASLAYRGGDYSKATSLYESLVAKSSESADVFYNLGNAYFKQEHLGRAILNYEKARRLTPRDRDILTNLEYVRGLLEYKIEDKRNWYFRTVDFLLGFFTQKELGIVSLSFGFLFWISWGFSLYRTPDSGWGWRRKTLLVVTALFLSLWVMKSMHDVTVQEAIVLKSQAAVRYGPSFKDQVAFRLGEGMKVRIQKKAEDWNRVVLPNGETGWMSQEELGEI